MATLTTEALTFDTLLSVLKGEEKIELHDEVILRVRQSHDFLKSFANGKVIYGINTGFGPMAQYKIPSEDQAQLQINLIRSHASGLGEVLSPDLIRATMLARLNTLCLGKSGVHESAILILQSLLNHDIYPIIFEHGGVGASGDLVQLAHLALVMIGEGEVLYQNKRRPTKEVFDLLGIAPMSIHLREGLAIMNGTSVMTGIGLINVISAEIALSWTVALTTAICELIASYDDYYSPQLNRAKHHVGQIKVAAAIYQQLQQSQFIKKREDQLYVHPGEGPIIKNKVQEYYSIRCVPQIAGVAFDAIQNAKSTLINEINSASDNPIVDHDQQNVFHGGNFHGDYVAFEMDKLKITSTNMTMLAERQINFLMNPNLNDLLPPFVNLGKLGFNFGLQGIQFTATSTTAENQMLANPMSIHSIPNNNDNQDIVSMGANAANITKKVIDNLFQVLAIEALSIAQAIDYTNKLEGLSPVSQSIYQTVRSEIKTINQDVAQYASLHRLVEKMKKEKPLDI